MNDIQDNIKKNIRDNIPKSLNFTEILASLKKVLWVFIIVFIAFNAALFSFLNGLIYFVAIIIGNVVFIWLCIPLAIWVGKGILIDRGLGAVDEVKEKFSGGISEEKIVKVVKKDEKNQ